MTTRRFLVLVRGLSPNSATTSSLVAARQFGAPPTRMARSEAESERELARMFGGGAGRVH